MMKLSCGVLFFLTLLSACSTDFDNGGNQSTQALVPNQMIGLETGNLQNISGIIGGSGEFTAQQPLDENAGEGDLGGAAEGMSYREVRTRLLNAGFETVERPTDQFCGYASACELPETDACAGAGDGQCSYNFENGQNRIRVLGIGDKENDPMGQEVTAIIRE